MLPVLLVGCLGVLALPSAVAIPYVGRGSAASPPVAAAAVVLPPGVAADLALTELEDRAPTRSFVTATPTLDSTPTPAPAVPAAPDAVPVGGAAIEAQAQTALTGAPGVTDGATGIPVTVLAAYRKAEANLAAAIPSCHLPWWLVAGIGRIETDHAFGGRVDANGNTRGRIMGPLLDGSIPGTAVIRDTDGGKLDGNATFDRGIGPMGFLPSWWTEFGKDGNGDGVADPNNVFDAATATGYVLCSVGDLSNPATMAKAVLRYNPSASYVTLVLTWAAAYRDGVTTAPDSTGAVPAVVAAPATTPPPSTAAPASTPSSSAPPGPSTSPPATTTPASTTTKPPSPPPSTPPPTTTTSPAPTTTTPATSATSTTSTTSTASTTCATTTPTTGTTSG